MDKYKAYSTLASVYDRLSTHDLGVWKEYLVGQLQKHGVPPGSKILDAACGTGLLSIALYRAGYAVSGMDQSAEMLTVACSNAVGASAGIPFIAGDLRHIRARSQTKAILCNCDGVNYLTKEQDAAAFFSSARRCLPKGGILIFDIAAPERLRRMDGQIYHDRWEEGLYYWSNEYDEDTHILEMELTIFTHRGKNLYYRSEEVHEQRAWNVQELGGMLDEAGFVCEIGADFTQLPPTPQSQRIHFTAIKAN